jgi:pyruvate dehydrogenase E2 component (dihydrolipoamide acetyltransferase)
MSEKIQPLTMPQWGLTMTEGTLVKWNAKEGDKISEKSEIAEIETEKIVNVLESPTSGVIKKLITPEGETLAVGALMGVIANDEISSDEIEEFITAYKPIELTTPSSSGSSASKSLNVPTQTSAPGEGQVNPAVKRLAKKLGVDLSSVAGTGRNGKVTKEDVEAASRGESLASKTESSDNPYESSALSSMRKTIAKRLTESKQTIPHFYLTSELNIDNLLDLKNELSNEEIKLSLNDLIIYSVAKALILEPRANVQFIDEELRIFKHADISLAIATDSGLIAPILRKADTKSLQEIATEVKDLAKRAQIGKLERDEIVGGTFSVSNLGSYGISQFKAIINPPQGAILAIGVGAEKIISINKKPVVANMMSVSLSCDHRIIDGAVGAEFLKILKDKIENPK